MKDVMWAAVLRGVKDLRLEELPIPKLGPDEVLVKIKVAGVCGTDVHMWGGTNFEGTYPFIPGHEWVGEVAEVGANVRVLKVGDRVTGEPYIPCRVCPICQDGGAPAFCPNHRVYGFQWEANGGMAEYHLSPEERLFRIPPQMSDDEAALVEPVSVAYHSIWGQGGSVAPHDRVGIFGAGPIGLFTLQVAKVSGAQVIVVEPEEYRQEFARKLGADSVIDPSEENLIERVMDLTDGLGLTRIIECSGSVAGIASTVDTIAVDGRIVLTGQSMGLEIPVELGKLIWKHAHMVGSCGAPSFFSKTIRFMSRGLIDAAKIITHRFPLSEVHAAFELGLEGTQSAKIVLDI